jgi:hypothetical protein
VELHHPYRPEVVVEYHHLEAAVELHHPYRPEVVVEYHHLEAIPHLHLLSAA